MHAPKFLTESPVRTYFTIVLCVLLLVLGFYLGMAYQKRIVYLHNSLDISEKNHQSSENPPSFRTLTFSSTNLHDAKTSILFMDGNSLYRTTLDGSNPVHIADFPATVVAFSLLRSSGTILVETQEADTYQHFWIIRSGTTTPTELPAATFYPYLAGLNSTLNTYIYTKELPSGTADILSDSLRGTAPEKIGELTTKMIAVGCETSLCPPNIYPTYFLPSPDGKLLLSAFPQGGGLGESAIVISRDGKTTYPIDFYWYLSHAIWISNSQLLVNSQDGQVKILTLLDHGTFSSTLLPLKSHDILTQNLLSPSRKLLVIANSLYAVGTHTLTVIKDFTVKSYPYSSTQILGWNSLSDKLLYSSTFSSNFSTQANISINLYDVVHNTTVKIATLHTQPKSSADFPVESSMLITID